MEKKRNLNLEEKKVWNKKKNTHKEKDVYCTFQNRKEFSFFLFVCELGSL